MTLADLRTDVVILACAISAGIHGARSRALRGKRRSAVWFWPYLFGMAAISYFSSFDTGTPSSIPLLGLDGPPATSSRSVGTSLPSPSSASWFTPLRSEAGFPLSGRSTTSAT
jgi:hypothetical protein